MTSYRSPKSKQKYTLTTLLSKDSYATPSISQSGKLVSSGGIHLVRQRVIHANQVLHADGTDSEDSDNQVDIVKQISLFDYGLDSSTLNPRSDETLHPDEIEKITAKRLLQTKHINAAMTLLRRRFPEIGALFNVQYGSTLSFPAANSAKWIQIIHDNDNHWLVAAKGFNDIRFVTVYDSLQGMHTAQRRNVPSSVLLSSQQSIKQHVLDCIACVLKTDEDEFEVASMPCQSQNDGYNCGVFAIAFATALAFDEDPSRLIFDKALMRNHLKQCLHLRKINPFPTIDSHRGVKKTIGETSCHGRVQPFSVDVHCICRLTWRIEQNMITCHICNAYYHLRCVSLNDDVPIQKKKGWMCSACNKSA